ncbi:WecB/TagA/CpsF family glycosyltransferase [Kocuria sediminis]|nr:WecB/TagA/CpsF family glycosyltransferase [Kocuria sediminis]
MANHPNTNRFTRLLPGDTDKTFIGGVPFTAATPQSAVEQTLNLVRSRPSGGTDIHLLNVYSVALATKDPQFARCVQNAAINLPDGKPVAAVSLLFGNRLKQVRGPAFFEDVISAGRHDNIRHFLLGSTPDTLSALEQSLLKKYPGALIVGTLSPPFRDLTDTERTEQDATIRNTGADIVWVGLGTPKQDYETRRLAEAGFTAAAVGAAFDFSAGRKLMAPKIIQTLGLEWLHRLISEPKRLWRRYLWGNTTFVLLILRKLARR